PWPWRTSISPRSSRTRRASRTAPRLTPNWAASTGSGGRRWPGGRRPRKMSSSSCFTMVWEMRGRGSAFTQPVHRVRYYLGLHEIRHRTSPRRVLYPSRAVNGRLDGELMGGTLSRAVIALFAAQQPEAARRFLVAYLRGQRDYYRTFVLHESSREEL